MSQLLYNPFTALILTVITVILCVSLYFNSQDIRQSSKVVFRLQEDLKKTSESVKKAQADLDAAKDPFTKEKIIRDQLLLQQPGEYIVQIPDLPPPPVVHVEAPKEVTPWEKWQLLLTP